MKKLLLLLMLATPSLVSAQYNGGYADRPTLRIQTTDPTGSCTGAKFVINSTTGDAFACYNGAWNTFGGGASFPLLASGSSCGTTPYSFTDSPTTGLCSSSSGIAILKSSGTLGAPNTSRLYLDTNFVQLGLFGPTGDINGLLFNTSGFQVVIAGVFTQFSVGTNITESLGVWRGPIGSAALPTYSFTNDIDTGMYRLAANSLGFSAGGTLRFSAPSAGGLDIADSGSKPPCDSSARGTFYIDEGGAGVADTVEVCSKDAADVYAWRTLIP